MKKSLRDIRANWYKKKIGFVYHSSPENDFLIEKLRKQLREADAPSDQFHCPHCTIWQQCYSWSKNSHLREATSQSSPTYTYVRQEWAPILGVNQAKTHKSFQSLPTATQAQQRLQTSTPSFSLESLPYFFSERQFSVKLSKRTLMMYFTV